jgi:hypothetical protein
MRWVLLVLAVVAAIYGCGQASSPAERQEKEGGVEGDEKEDKSLSEQKEKKEKVAPGYSKAAQASADAAKAAAAEHEMTPQDLPKMDDTHAAWLLACQMDNYAARHGEKALDDFIYELYQENNANDKYFLEKAFMREGFSCTWQEINAVAAPSGASPEE